MLKTLAIETSCDDTSVGIINFDGKFFKTEKLLAYSQIQDHQQYGGVVPEIASRLHSEKIIKVIQNIGFEQIPKIDFISTTTQPGLPGSLVVGKAVSKLLGEYFKKPTIEVNHIHGHIFSLFLERNLNEFKFPMMVLTASGGHNDLYLVDKDSENSKSKIQNPKFKFIITKVGHTLDDAAGECFDKVARMLGGPYPGGQRISQKAQNGKTNSDFKFKRIFLSKDKFEFSFSGFKSQAANIIKKLEKQGTNLNEDIIRDISYEFQEAVVEVLSKKLIKAGKKYGAKTLAIAGGVSSNDRLREYLNQELSENKLKYGNFETFKPTKKIYSTDNAAMIGVSGILKHLENNNLKH